ncbi:hypothetical protein POTOM_008483 [Populus tomentosa]|uniref:Uncharacterized protein n=1 Tax=Populus tomentosa TaxID=118781 RepID=A0A8X8AHF4_POPTO|nr:hypothetical protein POTOM_008483 [Populus tomentosa]
MAPRNSRGKAKGERKKKDEKVLPAVADITINLPDETHVVLKLASSTRSRLYIPYNLPGIFCLDRFRKLDFLEGSLNTLVLQPWLCVRHELIG